MVSSIQTESNLSGKTSMLEKNIFSFSFKGAATQLGPMYLLEIVPFNLKGAMGTCHMLLITMGIFAGSVFGLDEILGNQIIFPIISVISI